MGLSIKTTSDLKCIYNSNHKLNLTGNPGVLGLRGLTGPRGTIGFVGQQGLKGKMETHTQRQDTT